MAELLTSRKGKLVRKRIPQSFKAAKLYYLLYH